MLEMHTRMCAISLTDQGAASTRYLPHLYLTASRTGNKMALPFQAGGRLSTG